MKTNTLRADVIDHWANRLSLPGLTAQDVKALEPHVMILGVYREQQRPVPQDIYTARETYESTGITCYLPRESWLSRWLHLGDLGEGRKLSTVGAMRFLDRFKGHKEDCMEGY